MQSLNHVDVNLKPRSSIKCGYYIQMVCFIFSELVLCLPLFSLTWKRKRTNLVKTISWIQNCKFLFIIKLSFPPILMYVWRVWLLVLSKRPLVLWPSCFSFYQLNSTNQTNKEEEEWAHWGQSNYKVVFKHSYFLWERFKQCKSTFISVSKKYKWSKGLLRPVYL